VRRRGGALVVAGTAREGHPQGNIEWTPKPFVFEKGASIRYIDFEAGNDDNAGDSKEKPWKHHPWDANATARLRPAAASRRTSSRAASSIAVR